VLCNVGSSNQYAILAKFFNVKQPSGHTESVVICLMVITNEPLELGK
jgi:hypothetical protein